MRSVQRNQSVYVLNIVKLPDYLVDAVCMVVTISIEHLALFLFVPEEKNLFFSGITFVLFTKKLSPRLTPDSFSLIQVAGLYGTNCALQYVP
jgi:hypothetical protein